MKHHLFLLLFVTVTLLSLTFSLLCCLIALMTTSKAVSKPKTKRRGHPQTNSNSLANLIPYKKGENGQNGWSLKSELKTALIRKKRKQIVKATIQGAIDLVPVAFHEVWDRVEGPVRKDQPPVNQDNRVVNFVFILPDGTQVSPEALALVERVRNGNADKTRTD